MKVIRITATAHILKNKAKHIEEWQLETFNAIKDLLKPYADKLNVIENTKNHYELWTNLGYRSKSFHVKRNKGIAFASAIVWERYIGFYFYPLNVFKANSIELPERLQKNKTGVYTFHLKEDDLILVSDLKIVVKEGWRLYKENNLVRD